MLDLAKLEERLRVEFPFLKFEKSKFGFLRVVDERYVGLLFVDGFHGAGLTWECGWRSEVHTVRPDGLVRRQRYLEVLDPEDSSLKVTKACYFEKATGLLVSRGVASRPRVVQPKNAELLMFMGDSLEGSTQVYGTLLNFRRWLSPAASLKRAEAGGGAKRIAVKNEA